eukprot:CAMPEP_0184716918 /NCGR_PEP_ID=MMETSP0314-20130426/6536_1 /TAXON_ID=38298 /ORGANISM="Rhodella maculata, Strain CCMP 736" /LENGTH=57 /DNA_ID=CAMNT_0027180405 /DNA_START=367 /DNA_END=540 /DNA_ORIENTATION=+
MTRRSFFSHSSCDLAAAASTHITTGGDPEHRAPFMTNISRLNRSIPLPNLHPREIHP